MQENRHLVGFMGKVLVPAKFKFLYMFMFGVSGFERVV